MRWTKTQIKEALDRHQKWLKGEVGGERFECHDGELYAAHLTGVNLISANLAGAYLVRVNLAGAHLAGAYFAGADLTGANFTMADLDRAYFAGANLTMANLDGANLDGAYLDGAYLDEKIRIKFYPLCCPESGDFIGWKKAEGKIVKLKITGKRSSAYMRKCRCSEAEVLAIENIDGTKAEKQIVNSDYEPNFVYEVGKIVSVENFDEDRWNECSSGIHFFITRQEAVEYK